MAQRGFREMCDEGQRLEREGRFEDSRREYERALRRLTAGEGGASASTVLRWIARTWQTQARYEEGLDVLSAAYASAEADGDERALGHAQNLHAIILWRQGRLEDARTLYVLARDRGLRSEDPLLVAMASQNLGVIASIRGEPDQALRYYDSSLREYRSLEMHRDECITLNNLGLLQTRLGRWEDATESFRESLQLSRRFGYEDLRTQLEVNLAALTVARGDYAAATGEVAQALGGARLRADLDAVSEALKLSGIVARVRGLFDVAEVHFNEAAEIAESRRNVLLLAEIHREKAALYRASGRNRDLLRSLNAAHRLFSELKARHDLADIERDTRELEAEFIEVAGRWGESTESKDRYTQGHCERVADVACALARRVGFDATALFWFRIGTLLHDVGKLAIPEEVLNKPGRLTLDEWALVKQHPMAGVQLLSDIEFPWDIAPIVRSHHENWDGSGYPDGLIGEETPVEARLVCLADVYDALTSERSYRKALPHHQAMELMRRDVGRQFEPSLFRLFEEEMAARVPSDEPAPVPQRLVERPQSTPVDELTGVLLRRTFVEAASERLLQVQQASTGDLWTLAVIDVDAFKSVNDTFGHLQGDDVLRAIARVLTDGVREFDLAGRYAGDEFVLLLRAGMREAVPVAERLRETVARLQIPLRGSEEGAVTVTLSIGLSTAPVHGTTFESLFAAADRALYDAKRRGRNVVAEAGGETTTGKPKLEVERFVGRTEELAKLVGHFEASVRGEPRVISVVGEAGVGKTTLVRRIMSDVRLRTGVMVFGRSQEPDVRPPYGPWMDVIAGLHGLGVAPSRRWLELERLVPKLRPADASVSARSHGSKYALLDEITEYLRLAAAQRPLVLVLDDMQWGDTASWDAVEHVVSQLEKERILICLTIRREDADRIETNRQRISRSERYHELHLGRLLPDDVRSWVLGALQQPNVEDGLPDALYRFTEGNPLFVKQVLQALFDEGLLWHNGLAWEWRDIDVLTMPTAIDDLMRRRLTRLSPAVTKSLAVAAVFGRSFDLEDVAEAAGLNDDQLLDAVDEGIAAGVLEPSAPGSPSQYSFAHGLLADSLKRGVNPRRLQLAQLRVAAVLERRRPHALEEIAVLYDQGGDAERAYAFALRAGERSAAVYALDDAQRALRIAVRRASTDDERIAARRQLLSVSQLAGNYSEAEETCERLIEDAARLRLVDLRIAASRTRVDVRALRGESRLSTIRDLNALLAEAREVSSKREVVALLTTISDSHARQGEWADARRLAEEARDLATSLPDLELRADTALRLGTALLDTGPSEALTQFTGAAAMYSSSNNRFGETRCLVNSGIAYQRLGLSADAELAYRQALEMAESANIVDLAGLASLNLGVLLTRAGRYEGADEQFHRAMRSFKRVKNEPRRLAALFNLAHLAYERGDAAKAQDLAQATADLAEELGMDQLRDAAFARVGLAAFGLGANEAIETIVVRLERYHHGGATWFVGRECVEAFFIRYSVQQGLPGDALERFQTAMGSLSADPYARAWVVAECAALLRTAPSARMRKTLQRAYDDAQGQGFVPLTRRIASIVRTMDVAPTGLVAHA